MTETHIAALQADTSQLTMLGRPVERVEGQRPRLECFTTRVPLTRQTHRTTEWVSRSVVTPDRPEVYQVGVVYAPRSGRIVEAKSLREYGLSFMDTAASPEALAGQVAGDVLAATDAHWVEVSFRPVQGGVGARACRSATDAGMRRADAMPWLPADRRELNQPLRCVTVDVAATGQQEARAWLHEVRGWVSHCPLPPNLPDIYQVLIAYAPRGGQVLDADSLQEYAATFGNRRAFAEALAGQVATDVLTATDAHWVEVTFVQNVRGGWQIEAFQRLPAVVPNQPRQEQEGD